MNFPPELLPQLWWEPLRRVEKSPAVSCKDWLSTGGYFVDSCDAGSFLLTLTSAHEWAKPISSEVGSFTLAAFETMHSISDKSPYPKACAWLYIQSYYASYFSAHALLRIFGCAFCNLEQAHVQALYNSALACQIPNPSMPAKGDYEIWFDPSLNQLKGIKKNEKSHAGLWSSFRRLLKEIESKIPNLNAVANSKFLALDLLDKLHDALTKDGAFSGGNWLSSQRNIINYQLGLGTWFPYTKQTPEFAALSSKVKNWTKNTPSYSITNSTQDLVRAIESCSLLIWINRLFIESISESRAQKKSFIDADVYQFLQLASK